MTSLQNIFYFGYLVPAFFIIGFFATVILWSVKGPDAMSWQDIKDELVGQTVGRFSYYQIVLILCFTPIVNIILGIHLLWDTFHFLLFYYVKQNFANRRKIVLFYKKVGSYINTVGLLSGPVLSVSLSVQGFKLGANDRAFEASTLLALSWIIAYLTSIDIKRNSTSSRL